MLKSGRKPDVIAGVLAKEGIRICKETIYNYIYNHDEKGLWEYLGTKKGRKKRKKRTKRLNYLKNQKRTNIKHRTNEANKRSETGHFEADLILGGISEKKHIFTLTDRMSRKNFACFVYGKTSMEILTQSLKLISLSVGRENIKSITYDNGVEFAKFGAIETHS
jgi:IS30 family transposase